MNEYLVIAGLLAGVVVAHELGSRVGALYRDKDEVFTRQVGVVRAGILGMVAFLIGFAFSGAGGRFVDRADLIVKEANALGTAYLRADTVAPPAQGELKAVLKQYTADRVRLLGDADADELRSLLAKVDGLHRQMWTLAVKGTEADGTARRLVLPAINDVIDLHTTHLAMANRHLPPLILGVLLATAAIGFAIVGFGAGQLGRRFYWLDSVFGAVLALGLWMVIDLDYPRYGFIRLGNGPLVATLASMN